MVRALAKAGVVWSFTVVAATSTLAAQATTVTLQGTVTGIDGSVPEAAQVEVRSRETNVSRGALIDRAGSYRVLGLPPGRNGRSSTGFHAVRNDVSGRDDAKQLLAVA